MGASSSPRKGTLSPTQGLLLVGGQAVRPGGWWLPWVGPGCEDQPCLLGGQMALWTGACGEGRPQGAAGHELLVSVTTLPWASQPRRVCPGCRGNSPPAFCHAGTRGRVRIPGQWPTLHSVGVPGGSSTSVEAAVGQRAQPGGFPGDSARRRHQDQPLASAWQPRAFSLKAVLAPPDWPVWMDSRAPFPFWGPFHVTACRPPPRGLCSAPGSRTSPVTGPRVPGSSRGRRSRTGRSGAGSVGPARALQGARSPPGRAGRPREPGELTSSDLVKRAGSTSGPHARPRDPG